MLRNHFAYVGLLLFAPSAGLAAAHGGLLTNPEMTLVNKNAQATQHLLFPEQQISACWPYDVAKTSAPTGLAFCKVETPHMLNQSLHPLRGPDLYCSYLREEFCDVKNPKP